MRKIKVAMYGNNGHQIYKKLFNNENSELVAVSCIDEELIKDFEVKYKKPIKKYNSLSEMLQNDEIELVSLCSPIRSEQEDDAIACLRAKKHVYAEKPGALSEEGLDRILAVSKETGYEFHEMADSAFYEPYWTARKLIKDGKIGQVVQVYVQKSYPLRANLRPQNEVEDGGLIRQVGIHAVRYLEHLTGLQVNEVKVTQTHLGNVMDDSGLFTASSWIMSLNNGGVASACINYLNPRGFKLWGNESIRVFGTEGMLEITDGGERTHVYTNSDEGRIDVSGSHCRDFFDLLINHFLYGEEMEMTLEEELHPLRVVNRAFDCAQVNHSRK